MTGRMTSLRLQFAGCGVDVMIVMQAICAERRKRHIMPMGSLLAVQYPSSLKLKYKQLRQSASTRTKFHLTHFSLATGVVKIRLTTNPILWIYMYSHATAFELDKPGEPSVARTPRRRGPTATQVDLVPVVRVSWDSAWSTRLANTRVLQAY